MKKRALVIMLCLICSLGLIWCTDKHEGATNFSSKYVNLEVVENTNDGRVLADKDTGVLYLWYKDQGCYGQTLTPLYNANGSLKNLSDFDNWIHKRKILIGGKYEEWFRRRYGNLNQL